MKIFLKAPTTGNRAPNRPARSTFKPSTAPVDRMESARSRQQLDTRSESSVRSLIRDGLSSPSMPLDSDVAASMSVHLDHDFSQVQIHAGGSAAASVRGLNARAYTVGDHILFGPGEYRPSSREGQALIAHELTHVRQHASREFSDEIDCSSGVSISRPSDRSEVQAASVEAGVNSGHTMVRRTSTANGAPVSQPERRANVSSPNSSPDSAISVRRAFLGDSVDDVVSILGPKNPLNTITSIMGTIEAGTDIYDNGLNALNAKDLVKNGAGMFSSVSPLAWALSGGMAAGDLLERWTGAGSKAGDESYKFMTKDLLEASDIASQDNSLTGAVMNRLLNSNFEKDLNDVFGSEPKKMGVTGREL